MNEFSELGDLLPYNFDVWNNNIAEAHLVLFSATENGLVRSDICQSLLEVIDRKKKNSDCYVENDTSKSQIIAISLTTYMNSSVIANILINRSKNGLELNYITQNRQWENGSRRSLQLKVWKVWNKTTSY